jgi:hypothetical protein
MNTTWTALLLTACLAAPPPSSAQSSPASAVLLAAEGMPWRVENVAELEPAALGAVHHLWVWDAATAPQRLTPADLAPPRPADTARLKIVVPTGGKKIPSGFTVLAAPAAMWREVPEALLPSWPVPAGGRVLVPIDPKAEWRVRLVGPEGATAGRGTAWVEVAAGRPRIVLAPERAADRRVTVVGPDGEALAATLTVLRRAEEGGEVLAQYAADPQQRVILPRLPKTDTLHFLFSHPDHAPRALLGAPQFLPAVVTLERGRRVSGRFVDSRGKPLAGVEVIAQAWVPGAETALAERRGATGEEGRVALAALPQGSVALAARAEGFAPWRLQVAAGGAGIDLGVVTMERGLRLPVVAVDEVGMPVATAAVEAQGLRAVTDQRGQGELVGVPGATFTVTARAPGYLDARQSLRPPLPETLRLVLRRAFQVTGRMITEDGLAVHDGTVRITVGNHYREEALAEGGTFDLTTEPGVAVGLELRTPATVPLRLALDAGFPGEQRDLGEVRVDRGPVLRGRVVRATDGAPVAGARLWCPRPTGAGESAAWAQGDLLETRSAADGTFALSGLEPLPVVLRVDARGFAREHIHLVPDPELGFPEVGTVELTTGTALTVVVGEVGEGALARVDLRGRWRAPDLLTATVIDGEAVLESVPAGAVTVTVLQGRELLCETVVEVTGEAAQAVPCEGGGVEVTGTVQLGERLARGGELRWRAPSEDEEPGLILNRRTTTGLSGSRVYGSGRPSVHVTVGDDGTFRAIVKPGAWEVAWISPSGGPAAPPASIRVAAPGPHQLALRFEGTVVAGLVVDEGGQPVEQAKIRQLDGGGFALSRADGTFELTGMAVGEHTIQARLGEHASEVTPVRCLAGEAADPLHLVLRAREPQTVRIQVVDEDGHSRPGAFIFLEDNLGGRRILTTNAEGWGEARVEEPFGDRFRAAAVQGGRWSFGPWQGREQALAEGLQLTLEASGSLWITGEEAGLVGVTAPGNWDLVALLTQVGERPVVHPEAPAVLSGLPAGQYELRLGNVRHTAAIRGGDAVEVDFGRL